MHKVNKTKKGFTLVEMVLVVAIILILGGILTAGIFKYIAQANTAASKVETHDNAASQAGSDVNGLLVSNPDIT
ncbi:MAG: type II secretion system protein [Clostridiales bacterium]|nr:type II secretion system protein [Clostridiales bacterium]